MVDEVIIDEPGEEVMIDDCEIETETPETDTPKTELPETDDSDPVVEESPEGIVDTEEPIIESPDGVIDSLDENTRDPDSADGVVENSEEFEDDPAIEPGDSIIEDEETNDGLGDEFHSLDDFFADLAEAHSAHHQFHFMPWLFGFFGHRA